MCGHALRSCVVVSQRTQCHHFIPFQSIPFRSMLTFHTPALVSARILALVGDSLDSADGWGAESTPDSFRRVVTSIRRQTDQADGHSSCTGVIVVKVIHYQS